ncbi:MAG: DEAD/DEAH box helicase family protein [Aliarcobacter sp.]|nr:DEAD/DEAH box helicase family protein [Aliarcobacter sp.]
MKNKKTTILLKEHQIEAKNCILQEMEQNSRCQFISACGTGKTIVSQRTVEEYIEKFHTSIVLILVPSLELLSQFHKSWENNSNFKELFFINFFGDF